MKLVKMMFNLVSIIMPTYNSALFVVESIKSIQDQTYSNWELLITDDFSSDHTVELIKRVVTEDSRIKLFQLDRNGGAGAARNYSIEQASGQYIAFCDSDDLWKSNKLETQLAFMKECNADFSFTGYNHINVRGEFLKRINVPKLANHKSLMTANVIATATVMIRRDAFSDLSMPDFPRAQDYALWLKLLRQTERAYGLNEPLSDYRVTPNTGNRRKIFALKYLYDIYTQQEQKSSLGAIIAILRMYIHRSLKYMKVSALQNQGQSERIK